MSLNPSPALAALLSFIFPGAGQIYAGNARRGLVWAIPMLLFVFALIWLLLGGRNGLLAIASSSSLLTGVLVLNVAFFFYHVAAMVDAYGLAKTERQRGFGRVGSAAPIALAVLVALTMVLHGVPEVIGVDLNNFLDKIGNGPGNVIPSYSPGPTLAPTAQPSTTPVPSQTALPSSSPTTGPTGSGGPSPTPRSCPPIDVAAWGPAADGRLNILLAGSDSRSDEGAGSASIRTDSMMLMSIDIASCKAALFSFPRNMEHNPLSRYPEWFHIPTEDGGEYNGYLFGLWQQGARQAGCETQFDCEGGWRALTYAIQQMAGVQVDGVVSVNLKGFVALVEALPGHGVWIDVPYRLQDDAYYDSQQQRMDIDFRAGCQFLNGEEALAFARSRHQDSDYQRGRRQQIFLQQVRKQLDPLAMLGSLDALLTAAQQNLFMTFAREDFQYLAQVASRVDADRLYRFDFAPARLTNLGSMQGMAAKVNNIFEEPEPEPEDNPDGERCPPR